MLSMLSQTCNPSTGETEAGDQKSNTSPSDIADPTLRQLLY